MTDMSASRPGPVPAYEFTDRQNRTVAHLAVVMRFVGLAHVGLGVILAIAVIRLWTAVVAASLIIGVMAALVLLMGAYLVAAAAHFRRIATTSGNDVDNLMIALDELKNVYAVQRWVFVTAAIVVSFALIATVTVA
jgi:hypothetical protein